MALTILDTDNNAHNGGYALFELGFRPFFLGAGIFAIISVGYWSIIYSFHFPLTLRTLSLYQWHAHEMIYGFSCAVVTGFLLTAVKNWTGIQTLRGYPLLGLFTLWAIARILFLLGSQFLNTAAFFDIGFLLCAWMVIFYPVIKLRQWRQVGLLSKFFLLILGNVIFYSQSFMIVPKGAFIGIYIGLFSILAIILTIANRVMPMFIQNGVDYEVKISRHPGISFVSLLCFLLFAANYIFLHNTYAGIFSGVLLSSLLGYRLFKWHTPGIWKKPLLWGLYLALCSINLGFILDVFTYFTSLSPYLAIHALVYGGIGLATLSMMGRVTLGHTGRNVHKPPKIIFPMLFSLTIGVIFRVAAPLLYPSNYHVWILVSQFLWIAAFAMYLLTFSKMLISSRLDGKPG